MKVRALILLVAVALAACGGVPSRPQGPPPLALAADDVDERLDGLHRDLHAIGSDATDGKLDVEVGDQQVVVALDADELFEEGNGQLALAALRPLAEVAAAITVWGATVTHVVAFGRDGTIVDLAERRAASVAENLALRSIPRGRLRSESRVDEDRAGQILLILRPVVVGREAQAWLAPQVP